MENSSPPRWLEWAREIQALSQTGFHYAENDFQRERYERLMEIAAEIIEAHSELTFPRLTDVFRAQIGYATPRIDVRGAVFRDGKLLLVRERLDGGWTLPGGWADVGDMPSQAIEREVWEEAGFKVKASRVIAVYDANRAGSLELFHAFKIVFLCDLVSGNARVSNETSEVGFFGLHEIPAPLSRYRTFPRLLADVFAAVDGAGPPPSTVFD